MKGTRTSPYAGASFDRRVVSVRLSAKTINAVNEAAKAAKVKPSELIRAVLAEKFGLQRWEA